MTNGPARVSDIRATSLTARQGANGLLTVATRGVEVPFDIERVFTISEAAPGERRGHHAHKQLHQFLICTSGRTEVVLDDADERITVVLDSPRTGLHVPPGIWAEQTYLVSGTVLTVLCDAPYDEADYIRDHDEFVRWRKAQGQPSAGGSR